MNINHQLTSLAPNPPQPGRDSSGRYIPGTTANNTLGRAPRAREEAAIAALRRAATDADLDAIASDIVASARKGNWRAIRFLFEYLVGKPTIRVDSTRTEQGALWVFIQQIQAGEQPQVIDATTTATNGDGDGA